MEKKGKNHEESEDETGQTPWMLGYQEGYSDAYDEGYAKGFSDGLEKGERRGRGRIEFLKVKCACGYVTPLPVYRSELSTEYRIPDEEECRCPRCNAHIPRVNVLKAYSEYKRTR